MSVGLRMCTIDEKNQYQLSNPYGERFNGHVGRTERHRIVSELPLSVLWRVFVYVSLNDLFNCLHLHFENEFFGLNAPIDLIPTTKCLPSARVCDLRAYVRRLMVRMVNNPFIHTCIRLRCRCTAYQACALHANNCITTANI